MLIYICDDQQEEATALQLCLTKAAAELSADCTIKVYFSGETLIDAVENSEAPSLVILDVYMEGMSGIETGRRLRSLRPNLPMAFLTSSRDFAVDAFELNALHYIVKPVTVETARALLERLPAYRKNPAKVYEQLERQNFSGDPAVDSVLGYYLAQTGEEHIPMDCRISLRGGHGIAHIDMTVLLRVVNSCRAGPDTEGFTGWRAFPSRKKKGRTGVGLRSVTEIAAKYGGSAQFQCRDGEFTARVTLCMPPGDTELSEQPPKAEKQ